MKAIRLVRPNPLLYKPISCDAYDAVEIACMYRYPIELFLHDGSCIKGLAISTRTLKDDGEYLVLNLENELLIRLDTIQRITVLNANAKFQTVTLGK